jgi:hypothetical protein
VTYATSDGSATSPADFTATTGSLSWPDSDATPKTFTVAINDDSTFEGDETVNLTLSNATGGAALGSPGTATLTIVENDPAPASTLQFSAPSYGVGEGDGTVTITVNRSGSSSGAVGVSYATSNSTADGSDYTSASGTLSWGDGDTVGKTFTVAITDDASNESAESFNLALSSPTGGASLGSQSTASVTIVDNDTPPAGTLQFSAPTYSVGEAGGTATITVTRTGGSGGAVSVNYATSNGTATAGADYTAASGTLSWANGDTAPKTFTVGISPDTIQENDETVNLGLGGATGGATLGSQKTAVLTIVDDDNPIVINSISPSSICQGGPDFTLTVDGSGFDSGSIVQINGAARLTTFVDAGRLTAIVRASDIASPGSVAVRVANTNGATSNPAALTVNADTDTPVVTPPAAITVLQSMCSPSGDGASGNTSSTVAAFLVAGSATDGCTTTTTRLQPQAGGTDLSNASVFQSGTTQVTFRFRDNAGHVGTAMSSITVRLLGDLNLDGDVDATDLVIMANDLVGNLTAPADVSDVNRDRSVDAVDFVIEANHLVGNIDCLAN